MSIQIAKYGMRRSSTRPIVRDGLEWQFMRLLPGSGRLMLHRARAMNEHGPGCYVVKQARQPGDAMALAMLAREAAVANAVAHPHLVTVLSANRTCAVLPYLDGATIRCVLGHCRPSTNWALMIARQLASALSALHAAGWLHGQVTAEHVIVSPPGHATLIDLTEARRLGSCECDVERGGRLTAAADTYALGTLLFELLAGKRREGWEDVREVREELPLEVSELVRRMLSQEALRRPTDEELVKWLTEIEIEELLINNC